MLWHQAARKLGLQRALADFVPDETARTVVVQLAAGLSLGGRGQAAADLISEDTQAGKLLGIRKVVGPKRVHPSLVRLAGRRLRKRTEVYKPVGNPKNSRSAGWKRIRTESEPAAPEALGSLQSVNLALLKQAYRQIPKSQFKLGGNRTKSDLVPSFLGLADTSGG